MTARGFPKIAWGSLPVAVKILVAVHVMGIVTSILLWTLLGWVFFLPIAMVLAVVTIRLLECIEQQAHQPVDLFHDIMMDHV